MIMSEVLGNKEEKPLDKYITDGGFCCIFRTIGCIGDSLSSGEMESMNENEGKGYHDYYEYSWGQFIARNIGAKVYNFSKGGMTAEEYCERFAKQNNFWSSQKACQAYIIALGLNDINGDKEIGDIHDIDLNDWKNNKKTFAGYYGQIIQRLKSIQPKAKFFLMTIPDENDENKKSEFEKHQMLLYKMAELFDNTYVLDFRKFAPKYDAEMKDKFFLGGHMSAAGYVLTAHMVESYIDYIIRHNMKDFKQIAFVGTEFYNINEKW